MMASVVHVFLLLLPILGGIQCLPSSTETFISAFNIQVFGKSKMGKPEVVASLVKIISRYDMVFIQEIRDKSETAIYELLADVNAANVADPFSMELSQRMGTTDQKEQYAFMYRGSKLTLLDAYHWEDTAGIFERTPYVTKFAYLGAALHEFGYIGIHVRPDVAPTEIDALVDVYDDMVRRWNMTDFIIGGDLNAGCRYVTGPEWERIRLRHDKRFTWIIGDDTGTMVEDSCPYDRFLIVGDGMDAGYKVGSAKAYRFDQDLGLTEEEALDVSDHLPVEMVLH